MTLEEKKELPGVTQPLQPRPEEIEKLEQLLTETHHAPLPPEKPLDKQLTEFLAHVSHELKTPLTILNESLRLVLDGITGKLRPRQKEQLYIAHSAVGRLTSLVENLLDAARLTSGKISLKRDVTDMPSLLTRTVREFSPLVRKNKLKLELVTGKNVGDVFIDIRKIEQVLHNVLNNGIRFARSHIRVSVHAHEDPRFVEVDILDDGPGIPQKELRSIFQQFYQLGKAYTPQHKGLGLGLSIAKELVELHAGVIWAESVVGMGTRIAFTLPVFPKELLVLQRWVKRKAPASSPEFQTLEKFGLVRALLVALDSRAMDNDFKERVLLAYHEENLLRGEIPLSLDHIADFFESPLKDEHGRSLYALNMHEAFLMAYIEKNMGEFSWEGKPIYDWGETPEAKRKALLQLVKSMGHKQVERELEALIRQPSPKMRTR